MSIVAVDTITDAAGGNTASINGIPLRQGVIDPENRIINGAFDFWQRGTSSTANGYVAADRWLNAFYTGTVTQSRQGIALGDTLGTTSNPTYFLRQTVSGHTLAGAAAVTQQRIEGVRSYAGQTVTILGWARRSSGAGNMSIELEQYFGTGGTPSAGVLAPAPAITALSATWQPFAAVITLPSITGKALGTNNNDFLALNFWTSTGSDFNARSNSLGLQTIGVDLWGIHIKLGIHTADATALYKQPELGPELARCQRYYQKSYIQSVVPGAITTAGQMAWFASGTVNFHQLTTSLFPMRANPAVTLYSANTGASGKIRNATTGSDVNGVVTDISNQSFLGIVNNVSVSNAFLAYQYTADAEL